MIRTSPIYHAGRPAAGRLLLFALALFSALALAGGAGAVAVRALGEENEGICNYSAPMRNALLAHEEKEFFLCDSSPFTDDDQDFIWAGDLDLASHVGSYFTPGQGELDGYAAGSRVDLIRPGFAVDDINADAALESYRNNEDYREFGIDSQGSEADRQNSDGVLGLTFLLDGSPPARSGLTSDRFFGTEGELVWITFQMGDPPDGFSNWQDSDLDGDGFYLTLELEIETSGDSRSVFFLVNSDDPPDTLYAIPFLIPENDEIESTQRVDVNLTPVGVYDTRVDAADLAPTDYIDDAEDRFEEIERALARGDRATLEVSDDDLPANRVCDRSRVVTEALEAATGDDCDEISVADLAGIADLDLSELGIETLAADDFAGLAKLRRLDLAGNDISSLPAGVFSGVGSELTAPTVAVIDISDNAGPADRGFSLANVSSRFRASMEARQAVRLNSFVNVSDPSYGFEDSSYSVREGQNLVVGLSAFRDSTITFRAFARDSGRYSDTDCQAPCEAPGAAVIDEDGEYLLGFSVPIDEDENDDTFTMLYGAGIDPDSLDSIAGLAKLTVTEAAVVLPSEFDSIVVLAGTELITAPNNPDLDHNLSDLSVTRGRLRLNAPFRQFYYDTGGLTRWGYPTSEVLMLESGTLSQFFQRGVVDFHDVGFGWILERRLTWDYVGGGAGGSFDQGVEPAPVQPGGGPVVGFGHAVTNQTASGGRTGFLDTYNELGGVDSFGYAKTAARVDTNLPGTLFEPGTTPGFIRQYFQAAIFQRSAAGTVEITLLGDTLRNQLVPQHSSIPAFRRANRLLEGQVLNLQLIN